MVRNANPEYPWFAPDYNDGFSFYQSCHDLVWVLRCGVTPRSYVLMNQATGEEIPIRTDGGVYTALDMAEAVLCRGLDGTHQGNGFRS